MGKLCFVKFWGPSFFPSFHPTIPGPGPHSHGLSHPCSKQQMKKSKGINWLGVFRLLKKVFQSYHMKIPLGAKFDHRPIPSCKETGKSSLTLGSHFVQLEILLLRREYRCDGMGTCHDVK